MKYIKRFDTLEEQTAYLAEADIDTYVGYVDENDTVYYDDAIPVPYEEQYFTIESLEDGNEIKYVANYDIYPLSASTDNGKTWTEYKASTSGTTIATLNTGKKVLIKTTNINDAAVYNIISWFKGSKQHNVYGNAMSLVYGDDFIGKTSLKSSRQFYYLLSDNTNLISAENLILPATTLTDECYSFMFYNCTSLITTPELHATTLANNCYNSMFYGCTSLTTAPELPATTLASSCYSNMFSNCTSLTTAPELSATTLAQNCYQNMFNGCTNLTTAPELPATTLASSCYSNMFSNCTSLTTAPELHATILVANCYKGMFQGCTSLTSAPELPATTLAEYCYQNMFNGCTNLNYIKCLAITDFSNFPTIDWVKGVSSTGTFVKNAAMNNWSNDDPEYFDGSPYGWTVVDA